MNLEIICSTCENNGRLFVDNKNQNINSIYPNPTDRISFFKNGNLEEVTKIAVFDVLGKFLFEPKISTSEPISLDFLEYEPGIYWVTIHTLNGLRTEKLIIY